MSDALYHAVIVEHDRSPRNEGPLPGATHSATVDNPLCGDVVTMRAIVTGGGETRVIADAKFEARGCALCRAAASMLTSRVIGYTLVQVNQVIDTFEDFVMSGDGDHRRIDLVELEAFAGVQKARARRPCALLPFRALANALGRP
ncbi:MAG: Fe-S cluster assembly sulfur transfer protein SufU [Kofleriaceae bacterium]